MAAMGVLWIHAWTAHGNPRFYVWKVDFSDFLALGVNGVDLFFVISGFCMYYFYATKNKFSYHDFFRFLIKRWVRLSPAFYFISVIYILIGIFFYHRKIDGIVNFLHCVFYLNYIFAEYNTAAHFWTLTVEWQFYFTIPFLLIYQNRLGFKSTFFIIYGTIFFIAIISVFVIKNQFDQLTYTIFFRGIEFGCGIIAARTLIKNYILLNNRILWLLIFIIITYAGRVLVSKPILNLSYNYYNLLRLFGFTLMSSGFAGILHLSVTSVKWLNYILGNRVFKTMGRISYSFYLLHALVLPVTVGFTINYMPFFKGIIAPIITTFVSAIMLYPLSRLSYNMLEKPFLSTGNLTTK